LRLLSDEEIELWLAVAHSVARRKGAALPSPKKRAAPAAHPPAKAASREAPKPPPARQGQPLAPLEKSLRRKLARGGAGPDNAIDLHGMNQAEAHRALRGFLSYAQSRGDKLVLVVTGKGGDKGASPVWSEEPGVLRRLAPHWLRAPDLRGLVLGFEEAGRTHGGAGALYVRLRRGERGGR
jgi:DNA-nicking Smr family endonuclease